MDQSAAGRTYVSRDSPRGFSPHGREQTGDGRPAENSRSPRTPVPESRFIAGHFRDLRRREFCEIESSITTEFAIGGWRGRSSDARGESESARRGLSDRAGALQTLEAFLRWPGSDTHDGRGGRRRDSSRIQAKTEFLRPGRGHRAARRARAYPL